MEPSVPAVEPACAAAPAAGELPAQSCFRSVPGMNMMLCTVSSLLVRLARPAHIVCACVLAGFKRPRFKKIGMRRAKKTKLAVAEAEELMAARMAAAGGGQVPAEAKPKLHSGVAAAPAPADARTEELITAHEEVSRAQIFVEVTSKELARVERQHAINLRMFSARLDRWEREERSKNPPKPDLQIKRADKNIAERHKSEIDLAMIMYVAMEARAERAEAVGVADRLRIRLLQHRVRQLSKRQFPKSRTVKSSS